MSGRPPRDWGGAYGTAGRFVWAWSRGPESSTNLVEDELILPAPSGANLPTTRYRPVGAEPGPGWILLHGITTTGRSHPSLVRLARCFAVSGATVLVPEVDAWTKLQLAPHLTEDAVLAGLAAAEDDPFVSGRPGLIGFSFGGAQAVRVAASAARGRLACVGSLGGYSDVRESLEFLFTGEIVHGGSTTLLPQDSYGLWIIALNYLAEVPGYANCGPVLDALRALCLFACAEHLTTWGPKMRVARARERARLDSAHWPLFDLFAPAGPGLACFDRRWAEDLARELAAIGCARDPYLRFPDHAELELPVFLIHGRDDDLSPFTQTLALAESINAREIHLEVSALLAHSNYAPWPERPAAEALRLVRTFVRMLDSVRVG